MQAGLGALRFKVLGPLEVARDGEPLLQRAALQRRLLAALLAGSERAVPTDLLIEAIWEGSAPGNARAALLVYLHRLRRTLGDPQRISLEPNGYRIHVSALDCDAHAFEDLAATARRERSAGRIEQAADHYAQAMRMWRGEPYADVTGTGLIAAEAARLGERRLLAQQELLEVKLDLRMHAAVIGDLEALARSHPFRERLTALRMLALYRAGRQAEALEVFRESRAVLAEELGIDPGPLLQRVHDAILRRDEHLATVAAASLDGTWVPLADKESDVAAPNAATPRELPADVIGFTGRDGELRELEAARSGRAEDGIPPSPVIVLSGMGGVGKTATAVHWAHRIAADYPDGQLFLNLRGYSTVPARRPIEALAAMLRSLGLPSDQVPVEVEEAAARLRTETAGKRMLILLDNAASAEQVAPLVPGSSTSLVVVTSRNHLGDLLARHGAALVGLSPLTPDEATGLLKALLRIPRSADRPELAELARRSGFLPLALRIAAANAAGRSYSAGPSEYAGRESAGGQATLVGGPHAAVKATFDRSYRVLPDDARRVLRLLGIVPVRSLAVEAVAVLAQTDTAATERAVERLVNAHMVNRDGRGRLYLHDLIRDYADDLVEADDPVREAALKRLFEWYLDRADAACRRRYPGSARLSDADRSAGSADVADAAQAAQWLDDERENLIAVAVYAGDHGHGSVAWKLADILRSHAWVEVSAADFLALGQAALNGAGAVESVPGEAVAELCISTAYLKARDYADVVRHAERAIDLSRRARWDSGRASAHHNMALACWNIGRLRTSLAHGEAALAMNRASGRSRAASVNLGVLGVVHGELGELRTEARLHEAALRLAEEIGNPGLQASHLRSLAVVSICLGSVEAAQRQLDRVVHLEEGAEDGRLSGPTAENMAEICSVFGRYDEALAHADRAIREAELCGDSSGKARGLIAVALALNGIERFEGAVAAAAQALQVVNGDLAGIRINALIERSKGRLALGEVEAAGADAELILELAGAGEYRTGEAMGLNLLAEVRLRRGAVGEARELAQRALDDHRSCGHRPGEAWALWVLGATAIEAGDAAAAQGHWREVEKIYAGMGAPVPAKFRTGTG
ncbi:AfsR/SARP family transcriptional regulator [Glycomyces rhizosphaerae]|uniref:BTAD domain-containing putative transcriptional regulator n=1 Tax=Glycomyces rhizosphaerae TaxID=2054422 RepID=A0ABV7PZK0_9ACTN